MWRDNPLLFSFIFVCAFMLIIYLGLEHAPNNEAQDIFLNTLAVLVMGTIILAIQVNVE